jgi:hypothetical protein
MLVSPCLQRDQYAVRRFRYFEQHLRLLLWRGEWAPSAASVDSVVAGEWAPSAVSAVSAVAGEWAPSAVSAVSAVAGEWAPSAASVDSVLDPHIA